MSRYDQMAETVVNQLVGHLRDGAAGDDVRLQWHTAPLDVPTNPVSGVRYRGINFFALTLAALGRGWPHNLWGTYRQWASLSTPDRQVHVRKGERGTGIIAVFDRTRPSNDDEDLADESNDARRRHVRVYSVFNAAQIEGFEPPATAPLGTAATIDSAERWVTSTGAAIRYGFNAACYRHGPDVIEAPAVDQYDDPIDHYAVLAHELVHWTGHGSRLARSVGLADPAEYALEELVAELGAAMVCCALGLTPVARRDHACYLGYWIQQLDEDPTILVRVAAAAQRAVDLLNPAPWGSPPTTPAERPELAA